MLFKLGIIMWEASSLQWVRTKVFSKEVRLTWLTRKRDEKTLFWKNTEAVRGIIFPSWRLITDSKKPVIFFWISLLCLAVSVKVPKWSLFFQPALADHPRCCWKKVKKHSFQNWVWAQPVSLSMKLGETKSLLLILLGRYQVQLWMMEVLPSAFLFTVTKRYSMAPRKVIIVTQNCVWD